MSEFVDHRKKHERRQRDWDMNPYPKQNGNGTLRTILTGIIVFIITFFGTMYWNAVAMSDKYATKLEVTSLETKLDVVYQYVIEQKAIQVEKEKEKKAELYDSFKR